MDPVSLYFFYRYRFSKENTKKTPYRSRKANYKKVIMMGGCSKNGFLQVQTAVNKAFKIVICILKNYAFEIKTFA